MALVAAGNTIGGIGAIVAFDRIGKGIRTAPRDALISLSSTKDNLATSFGVHRAMDSAGAMLGPLVAFGILLVAPARFDAVFVVSTLFAVLGLAVLVLTVQGKPGGRRATGTPRHRCRPRRRCVRDPRFGLLLLAAVGLSIASVSDAMIYVGLQRKIDFEPAVFPLLYVITAVVFMGLAIPVGQLADRVGRVPVLLAGYALLFVVYGALLMTSLGYGMLILCLVALGAYFAATEGVLTAIAGAVLPEKLQASGIGILITVVSIGHLLSSLAFGALWLALGLQSAVIDLRRRPGRWRSRSRRRCCCGRSGARCMDRRSKKILARDRRPLRRRRRRLRRDRRARRRARRRTDARPEAERRARRRRLMVRAVDPKTPASTAASSIVEDGKVQPSAPGDLDLRARLLRGRQRASASGSPPPGSNTRRPIFDSEAAAAAHRSP